MSSKTKARAKQQGDSREVTSSWHVVVDGEEVWTGPGANAPPEEEILAVGDGSQFQAMGAGLAGNAFCPGEGAKDNSCPPGGRGSSAPSDHFRDPARFEYEGKRPLGELFRPKNIAWMRKQGLVPHGDHDVTREEALKLRDAVNAEVARQQAVLKDPTAHHATVFRVFHKLDRSGSNLVDIADLRDALSKEGLGTREQQDAVLQDMRRKGKLSISTYEGHHGLTPRQRAAAITEQRPATGRNDVLGEVHLRE